MLRPGVRGCCSDVTGQDCMLGGTLCLCRNSAVCACSCRDDITLCGCASHASFCVALHILLSQHTAALVRWNAPALSELCLVCADTKRPAEAFGKHGMLPSCHELAS